MINAINLVEGQEYYFHFQNYFCSGFFKELVGGNIKIYNGHYFYIVSSKNTGQNIYAYDEAVLDPTQLISFATT